MANVSTARKLGIAARIAGQQVRRTRIYSAVLTGARTTLSHMGAVVRQLWHEVTGFAFLAFATAGGIALIKEYSAFHLGKATASRVAAAGIFTVMFAWFGCSSFMRARKRK